MGLTLKTVTLQDKYTLKTGKIYLTGLQALVRLPLMQKWRDEEKGLTTGGFISGYRGSPLGAYDLMLWQAQKHLKANHIVFQPGINEDLGATSVWGSQQVTLFPGSKVQGAFGLWYGKGPGVDRTGDVFKHANAAGTSTYGGVLAIAGDDHACKSSTLPHQSEFAFMDAGIPILHPSDIQDVLDFGIYGWALSRYSGCWVTLKAISDTMDSSASVYGDYNRQIFHMPQDFEVPPLGLHIRWPDIPIEQEERLYRYKLPAVHAFIRANPIDRITLDSPTPRLGIMTTGKSYYDTCEALSNLGITPEIAQKIGIRIYKVGLVWPLEPQGVLKFAEGLQEIFVVEEKRPLLESQTKDILYHAPASKRPIVIGKTDGEGKFLLPSTLDLTVQTIQHALANRLLNLDSSLVFPGYNPQEKVPSPVPVLKARAPFYCSGCPHNTSTKVPEGSRAMAGIGCHYMATWIYPGTYTFSQMGGEGVPWIGQAPFTETSHVFVNMGDGTYYHSGILAIRASISAKVNVTYKILFNDAVAMTGGQPVDGPLTVPQLTLQLAAEGVETIAVVTDEPEKYPLGSSFAPHVRIEHRDQLERLEKEFRDISGTTVIIYDQTCAAEKRRRRKRNLMIDPPKRLFIHESVCEACGDCSKQSNCLSIVPKETSFGTKRMVDQSTCNKDYSCVKGFCPSFVNVIGGTLTKISPKSQDSDIINTLPDPTLPDLTNPYSIFVAGVGGTGIVTIGALIGMAAHLEGKGCSTVDMTGLSQKGGAVVSHVKIAKTPESIGAKRISSQSADLILGCDMVVACGKEALAVIQKGKTYGIMNSHQTITSEFVKNPYDTLPQEEMVQKLETFIGSDRLFFLDATHISKTLAGDSIATNIFLLGYAYQKGLIPISREALEETIRLNGVAVDDNLRVFRWGRLAAHDLKAIEKAVHSHSSPLPQTLESLIEHRANHLTQYQNKNLAAKYLAMVQRIQAVDPYGTLARAVAHSYAKLLSYKDEYEVARLYADPQFKQKLQEEFSGPIKLEVNLAPPLLAKRDPETGQLQKMTFGPWIFHVFKILSKFKGLRGSKLDVFGYTHERRQERQLIQDYEILVEKVLENLTPKTYEIAVKLLSLPDQIRGYGHVKEANIQKAKDLEQHLLQEWDKMGQDS